MAMASRRKEPPKRPGPFLASFSPPLLALFFVLLFFVAFKVDDNGEFEISFAAFCSVCHVIEWCQLIASLAGIDDGWVIHCPRRYLLYINAIRGGDGGG